MTSKAITELLERKGEVVTGDSKIDIKTAKKYLPLSRNEYDEQVSNGKQENRAS